MAEQESTLDKLVKELYDFASQKMKEKASDDEIMSALMQKGLDRDCSRIIVSNLRGVFNAARRRS